MPNRCYNQPCPCRECEDRHATCHNNCDKYKDWKKDVTVEPPSSIWIVDTPARRRNRTQNRMRRL